MTNNCSALTKKNIPYRDLGLKLKSPVNFNETNNVYIHLCFSWKPLAVSGVPGFNVGSLKLDLVTVGKFGFHRALSRLVDYLRVA